MAYAHCHKCNWSQDDFWDEGYNPIRYLLNWEEDLLDFGKLDEPFTDDAQFIKERGNLSRREVIAQELEKHAETIRKMKILTNEEANTAMCPNCGEERVCID